MKGSYILLIQLREEKVIRIGSLSCHSFFPGYYAYVGSAMGGLKSRLNRHRKKDKKPHWHIDYLLEEAILAGITICETEERAECLIAQALSSQLGSISGFGSSDCRCRSHLFFAASESQIKSAISAILSSLPVDKRIHPITPEVEVLK
jgi:Uri superfamily endonuclease